MKEFQNKNVEKNYNKIVTTIYVSILMIVVGLVLLFYGVYKSENISPTEMHELIINNPVEDEYGSIEITQEPFLFAEYENSNIQAYFVTDGEYYYVVEMKEDTYQEIVRNDYPQVLEGSTLFADDSLKEVAIDTLNDSYEEDVFSKSDYDDIFGSIVLDIETTPLTANDAIIILGVFLLFGGLIFLIVSIILKMRYLRFWKKLSLEEKTKIVKELNDEKDAFYYETAKLYLTKNYLVNLHGALEPISYKDVIWMYPYEFRYYGFKTNQSIIVVTKDKKKHTIAMMNFVTKKNKEVFEEIYQTISSKNKDILTGFTKENQQTIKKL